MENLINYDYFFITGIKVLNVKFFLFILFYF